MTELKQPTQGSNKCQKLLLKPKYLMLIGCLLLLFLVLAYGLVKLCLKQDDQRFALYEHPWTNVNSGSEGRDNKSTKNLVQKLEVAFRVPYTLEGTDNVPYLLCSVRKLQHQIPDDVSTSLQWDDNAKPNFTASDQFLWAEYCIQNNEPKLFAVWYQDFQNCFLPEGRILPLASLPESHSDGELASTWPQALTLIRTLLLAGKTWGDTLYLDEALSYAREVLPFLADGLPADCSLLAKKTEYPLVSGKDGLGSESKAEPQALIRAASLDLWTAHTLASFLPEWQEVYDLWQKLLQQANLGNGFYAFGFWPETYAVRPNASQDFECSTVESLRTILHLLEDGQELADLALYGRLILRDGTLRTSYNLATLEASSEQVAPEAAVLLERIAVLTQQKLLAQEARQALLYSRSTLAETPAEGLLFTQTESVISYRACANFLILLNP